MGRYISNEKGRIITDLKPGDKIIKQSSIDAFKKKMQKEKMEGFIMYNPELKEKFLYQVLTNSEIGFFDKIVNKLQYNSPMLMINKHIPIRTINDFMNIGNVSKQSVLNVLQKLIELKVIYKTNKRSFNYYFVNPYIYFKGNNITEALTYAHEEHGIIIEKIII